MNSWWSVLRTRNNYNNRKTLDPVNKMFINHIDPIIYNKNDRLLQFILHIERIFYSLLQEIKKIKNKQPYFLLL